MDGGMKKIYKGVFGGGNGLGTNGGQAGGG